MCLVFDEVKIKEYIVYDKHTGQLIGFMNIGEVNNQLLQLEQVANRQLHNLNWLTLMVRGLLSGLDFPYASFFMHNWVVSTLLQKARGMWIQSCCLDV